MLKQHKTLEYDPKKDHNMKYAVLLNGSGSHDPDGEPITFEWRQTSGPNVELKSGNASFATFTAPTVSNDTRMSLICELKTQQI